MEENGRGDSSGRLLSPPLPLPAIGPSSVPPAALPEAVLHAVLIPLPPANPPLSVFAAVNLASGRPQNTPTETQNNPPCVSLAPTPTPTTQSTATTYNLPCNSTI